MHGQERKFNRFIPKVLNQCLIRLKDLIKTSLATNGIDTILSNYEEHKSEVGVVVFAVNSGKWEAITECSKISELCAIFVELIGGI